VSLPVFLVLLVLSASIAFFLMRAEHRTAASAPDRAVLDQLQRAGSDLSQPHPIEFFLHLPSEAAASPLGEHLASNGFVVRVQPSQGFWTLVATKRMVPAESALVALRSELSQRAAAAGGSYDGWGTPVVPAR
jgi:hypothetical protein